ncbi:hypothetical protein ABK040_011238 [Willaertia magna]
MGDYSYEQLKRFYLDNWQGTDKSFCEKYGNIDKGNFSKWKRELRKSNTCVNARAVIKYMNEITNNNEQQTIGRKEEVEKKEISKENTLPLLCSLDDFKKEVTELATTMSEELKTFKPSHLVHFGHLLGNEITPEIQNSLEILTIYNAPNATALQSGFAGFGETLAIDYHLALEFEGISIIGNNCGITEVIKTPCSRTFKVKYTKEQKLQWIKLCVKELKLFPNLKLVRICCESEEGKMLLKELNIKTEENGIYMNSSLFPKVKFIRFSHPSPYYFNIKRCKVLNDRKKSRKNGIYDQGDLDRFYKVCIITTVSNSELVLPIKKEKKDGAIISKEKNEKSNNVSSEEDKLKNEIYSFAKKFGVMIKKEIKKKVSPVLSITTKTESYCSERKGSKSHKDKSNNFSKLLLKQEEPIEEINVVNTSNSSLEITSTSTAASLKEVNKKEVINTCHVVSSFEDNNNSTLLCSNNVNKESNIKREETFKNDSYTPKLFKKEEIIENQLEDRLICVSSSSSDNDLSNNNTIIKTNNTRQEKKKIKTLFISANTNENEVYNEIVTLLQNKDGVNVSGIGQKVISKITWILEKLKKENLLEKCKIEAFFLKNKLKMVAKLFPK